VLALGGTGGGVYDFVDDSWRQRDDRERLCGDERMAVLALSADGLTAAGLESGRIKMFRWQWHRRNGLWFSLSTSANQWGFAGVRTFALSANGETMVIVGADGQKVKVVEWRSGKQLGGVFNVSAEEVAISGDGSVVAIAVQKPNNEGGVYVEVFSFDEESNHWRKLGSNIEGRLNIISGKTMALSNDGMILTVGALGLFTHEAASVQVLHYTSELNGWIPMGQTIGGLYNHPVGDSVALSGDGSILVVTSRGTDLNEGAVRVRKFNGATWRALATQNLEIDGNHTLEGVALSGDGYTLVLVEKGRNNYTDVARVYSLYS